MGIAWASQRQTGEPMGKVHGPTRPRQARRWALFVVARWCGAALREINPRVITFFDDGDTVIALRIGCGWTTVAQDEPYYTGWTVSSTPRRGQVASADEVVDGDVLWRIVCLFWSVGATTT